MPLKQGSTNVVRLYRREVNLKYLYYGTSLPTGAFATPKFSDPSSESCSIAGEFASYSSGAVNMYYRCQEVVSPETEVTHLKDNQNRAIHKRVTISFNSNGGSGSSAQTRTWGVEQILQPSNPTRSGYDFQGWATTSGATSPNVTLPRDTPENNITYYAVWKQQSAKLTWQYQGKSSAPFCGCLGYNPIGTTCSSSGSTQVVCGNDVGKSGSCYTIVCKA